MAKRRDNNVVLAFGDTHLPYQHKHMLEFLGDVNSTYKPDRVIHMGDLLDIYSVSSYPTDPDHPDTWSQEIKKARKILPELYKLFPNVDILECNHDDRAYKKSRIAGIPREYLIPFKKLVGAPEEWKWHMDLRITVDSTREQLYFAHTKTGGALVTAKDLGCSAFLGHNHSKFGASAFSPTRNKMLWGVDCGCLVSDKGSPFKYNKGDRGRPINGCVIITEGVPLCIPLKGTV